MARSAKPARPVVRPALGSTLLRAISANPVLLGGATAFLVSMSYVSANALWYQPHAHKGAFFATRLAATQMPRAAAAPETTIIIERPKAKPAPKPDPATKRVQAALRGLGLYDGTVDGLAGPNTRRAIENYQRRSGTPVTGAVDAHLLDRLLAESTTGGIKPQPSSRQVAALAEEDMPAVPQNADLRVVRVQAGLKAFGNDGMEIDGVVGSRTRSAILEFQTLFGLPATGAPDDATLAKMREIGLTD